MVVEGFGPVVEFAVDVRVGVDQLCLDRYRRPRGVGGGADEPVALGVADAGAHLVGAGDLVGGDHRGGSGSGQVVAGHGHRRIAVGLGDCGVDVDVAAGDHQHRGRGLTAGAVYGFCCLAGPGSVSSLLPGSVRGVAADVPAVVAMGIAVGSGRLEVRIVRASARSC